MDTTDAIDLTEVIDATGEPSPDALLLPFPALGTALMVSAYDFTKQLITWEVASTYDFAKKVIEYQQKLAEKVTEATA